MYIEQLGRHFSIGSRPEAEILAEGDYNFWNVISLIGPDDPAFPAHRGAKSLHTERFLDIEDLDALYAVRKVHLERVFSFVDELEFTEPILVHCVQGLSRSTAVALGIIARALYLDGEDVPVPEALEIIFKLRPVAAPNPLVMKIAFEQFLPANEVEEAIALVRDDERVMGNQFSRF